MINKICVYLCLSVVKNNNSCLSVIKNNDSCLPVVKKQ